MSKLVVRARGDVELRQRLFDSGIPSSIAYIGFWPTGKFTLKSDALKVRCVMCDM